MTNDDCAYVLREKRNEDKKIRKLKGSIFIEPLIAQNAFIFIVSEIRVLRKCISELDR